jgi:hypothetical protein
VTIDPIAEVTSVSVYLEELNNLGTYGSRPTFWFRGHTDATYVLAPSSFRSASHRQNEGAMIKRFMLDAQRYLTDVPAEPWDWLFMAQHHGVPTRLLDWTENALVGLFFACENTMGPLGIPPDGDVWILEPTALNTVSNLYDGQHRDDVPMFGIDAFLEPYHPFSSPTPQTPLHPVAALAARSFQRITAQWGTFTITGKSEPLEAHPSAAGFLKRVRIPATSKLDILQQLAYIGIEERIVYPDLHRLGQRVKGMFQ